MKLPTRALGRGGPSVTRLGLGLAAIGRPAYHNLGHADDLDGNISPDALETHAHAVLDAAWEGGVRTYDTARSYGEGEAFLGRWLHARGIAPDAVMVGSKWGYTYVGDWTLDAPVHEVKDHGLATFLHQRGVSLGLLGPWLGTYSVHSATLASGVLEDAEVHDALRTLRDETGVRLGLTVTGPGQADSLRAALALHDLFQVVQATFNLLEPSVGPALAAAHDAGWGIVVKEGLANGRLSGRAVDEVFHDALLGQSKRLGTTPDALALAWVLSHPWVDVALSGAATPEQVRSNLAAIEVAWDEEAREVLARAAERPESYWARRSELSWT